MDDQLFLTPMQSIKPKLSYLKSTFLTFGFSSFILALLVRLVTTIVVLYINLFLYVCMFILLCNVVIC